MSDTNPPERSSLEDILRRAAAGDESAWWTIVETYSKRVFGLIRSQCGDADLADEITQSTFCTVATKIGDYDELGRFEPWLFRIAMNRLRDEMRRRRRQAVPVESEALAGMAGAAPERTESGPEAVEIEALRRAMSQLSEADQKILHLRHCTGMSFKLIAEALDQPLGTVLARQHRALKKLKEALSHLEANG